jgi:hypothetical protein
MNLKLEELRKRLLEPIPGQNGPNSSLYRHSSSELYPTEVHEPEDVPLESSQAQQTEGVNPPGKPEAEGAQRKSVTSAVLQYVEQAAAANPGEAESMDENGQYQVAQAVAKVFEQTKLFQDRLAELNSMFEPIERAGEAAVRTFEPLRSFQQQLMQLAESFGPMRDFQLQLAQLARTFEPMKGLQQQLAQISEAFQIHLTRLTSSLEPAKRFQAELIKLSLAFEPVNDLQKQFAELAERFRTESSTHVNGSIGAAPMQH